MSRLLWVLSCCLIWLAPVLATFAVLAVPESAYGDGGGDWCASYCGGLGLSDEDYQRCYGACYDGYYTCDDCAGYIDPDMVTWCYAGCQGSDTSGPYCRLSCDCSAISACQPGLRCVLVCKCKNDPTYGYICD
jgi:hypothetical protein